MPARELADGALILVGGTLLLTPGFVTDIAGLVCVLPFTRPLVRGARAVPDQEVPRFAGRATAAMFDPAGPGATRTRQRPGPDGVVQGEVID